MQAGTNQGWCEMPTSTQLAVMRQNVTGTSGCAGLMAPEPGDDSDAAGGQHRTGYWTGRSPQRCCSRTASRDQ
jgi:hypothetical protein